MDTVYYIGILITMLFFHIQVMNKLDEILKQLKDNKDAKTINGGKSIEGKID